MGPRTTHLVVTVTLLAAVGAAAVVDARRGGSRPVEWPRPRPPAAVTDGGVVTAGVGAGTTRIRVNAGLVTIAPAANRDCAISQRTGSTTRVGVAMPGRIDYTDAGWAEWRTSVTGSCAGFRWVVLHLDPVIVQASDVCRQFDCRVSVSLMAPALDIAIASSTTRFDGGGEVTTAAVQTGGGQADATAGTYAMAFLPDATWFSV